MNTRLIKGFRSARVAGGNLRNPLIPRRDYGILEGATLKTLANVTLSSAGKVKIQGTLSDTLGDIALDSDGTVTTL